MTKKKREALQVINIVILVPNDLFLSFTQFMV